MKGQKYLVNISLPGYHIAVDEWNWCLYSIHETKDKDGNLTGETYEVSRGYFHTLGQLLKHIAHLEVLWNLNKVPVEKLLSFYGGILLETRDKLLRVEEKLRESMEINKAPLVNESIMD